MCTSCIKMEYGIADGQIEEDFDFAEDAYDFETQLSEARDVKFTQTLEEPLSIGTLIICTGTPTEDLSWFALNIGHGEPDTKSDIALHFNVRLPQRYVVRNTKRHGRWGAEETTSFRLFPFKMGGPFTLEMLIGEKEILIAVDGEHFCNYTHRNPSPFTATWVQVAGVRDCTLNVQKTDIYPLLAPPRSEVPYRDTYVHGINTEPGRNEPKWQPNVIATLMNGVPEGNQLVIYGRLRPILHSFAVDLIDEAREWPHPNVHVHVNVRAHDESQLTRQLVVLNAWFGGWGPERRQRTAKLIPGSMTTLRILRGTGEWSVFCDELMIGELEFRAAAAGVKALRIRGDLYPQQIYICPASSSPVQKTTRVI